MKFWKYEQKIFSGCYFNFSIRVLKLCFDLFIVYVVDVTFELLICFLVEQSFILLTYGTVTIFFWAYMIFINTSALLLSVVRLTLRCK